MSIVLSAVGVAFAAFCVWLTVRIINRRERWAKWTAVGLVVGIPILYVLSIGPADYLEMSGMLPASVVAELDVFYLPLRWALVYGPKPISEGLDWYLELWTVTPTVSGPGPHVQELKP